MDILCTFSNLSTERRILNLELLSCEEFASQGCKVYASSRSIQTIADFADSSIEKLALDVTSDVSVQTVLDTIVEKEGKIDIVVNNAGLISAGASVYPGTFESVC